MTPATESRVRGWAREAAGDWVADFYGTEAPTVEWSARWWWDHILCADETGPSEQWALFASEFQRVIAEVQAGYSPPRTRLDVTAEELNLLLQAVDTYSRDRKTSEGQLCHAAWAMVGRLRCAGADYTGPCFVDTGPSKLVP